MTYPPDRLLPNSRVQSLKALLAKAETIQPHGAASHGQALPESPDTGDDRSLQIWPRVEA